MIGETRFEVAARLDENGEVKAKVIGRCSYGQGEGARDASEFVEVTDAAVLAKIGKALAAATGDVRDALNRQTVKAAAKCLGVASERGEI